MKHYTYTLARTETYTYLYYFQVYEEEEIAMVEFFSYDQFFVLYMKFLKLDVSRDYMLGEKDFNENWYLVYILTWVFLLRELNWLTWWKYAYSGLFFLLLKVIMYFSLENF